jgi:hypothetical protein
MILLASSIERLLAGQNDLCVAISADQIFPNSQELYIQAPEPKCVLVWAISEGEGRNRDCNPVYLIFGLYSVGMYTI